MLWGSYGRQLSATRTLYGSKLYQYGSNTVKHVVGKPSDYLGGRQLTIPCGQCVGGGSSVGWMVYTRQPASDYYDWANVHNNPGWSFNDLLPPMTKAETYQVAPGQPSHGYDGPLKVSYGVPTSVGEEHVAAVLEYDKVIHAMTDDGSSITHMDMDSFERWPKWIDVETGRRSDVAHGYIYPALEASQNVHLLSGCMTRKVIIADGKATGVEYVVNSKVTSHSDGTPRTARATRLVVLSAGTFGSPGILERSGIGEIGVLERNGIEQVVDLPGDGEHFCDHPLITLPFHAKEDADTIHGITHGDRSEHEKWSAQWHEDGQGLMGTNGLDSAMWCQPTEQELRKIGPEFAERWASFHAGAYYGTSPPPANHKVYCTGGTCTYPLGTDSVHITSAHDVDSPLDFETGRRTWPSCVIFGNSAENTGDAYPLTEASTPRISPSFQQVAQRRCRQTARPIRCPDIVYTEEDDRAIDDCLKAYVITPWDSLGTCAMRSRDKGGVVDSRLNVYGVQNLKVADMSICPCIIAASACSTAVLVGEKAALIIGEEMGITGV